MKPELVAIQTSQEVQDLGPPPRLGATHSDISPTNYLQKHYPLSIDHLVNSMSHVDVISPFIWFWFFDAGKYGDSHQTQHQVYQRHELPRYLDQFNTWFSFKLKAPTPNKFSQPEMRTIHCNPGISKQTIFDPVFIETAPDQNGLKHTYLGFWVWIFTDSTFMCY